MYILKLTLLWGSAAWRFDHWGSRVCYAGPAGPAPSPNSCGVCEYDAVL